MYIFLLGTADVSLGSWVPVLGCPVTLGDVMGGPVALGDVMGGPVTLGDVMGGPVTLGDVMGGPVTFGDCPVPLTVTLGHSSTSLP